MNRLIEDLFVRRNGIIAASKIINRLVSQRQVTTMRRPAALPPTGNSRMTVVHEVQMNPRWVRASLTDHMMR